MEKYGFIYIWLDKKHKRYYVGAHFGTIDDGYICSSGWMNRAYKKRTNDFKRRIIISNIKTKEELYLVEQHWLSLINKEELGKRYYNLRNHKFGHWSEENNLNKLSIKEKISIKTKEAMQNPEVRERYLKGLKTRDNRSSEIEVREKRSASMMGKNKGKDNSKAIAISAEMRRGKPLSDEHRNKIKCTTVFNDINNKKIKCTYCDFIGNPGNIGRYHNERCKKR